VADGLESIEDGLVGGFGAARVLLAGVMWSRLVSFTQRNMGLSSGCHGAYDNTKETAFRPTLVAILEIHWMVSQTGARGWGPPPGGLWNGTVRTGGTVPLPNARWVNENFNFNDTQPAAPADAVRGGVGNGRKARPTIPHDKYGCMVAAACER